MKKNLLYALPLILLVLAALGLSALLRPPPMPVPDFTADGLAPADLPPDIAVVNFFASWCPPCHAEHPVLMDLSDEVPVYGIAYLDDPAAMESFLKDKGNPYRKAGIDKDGAAGAAWAVGGLPTSFIIRDGRIIRRLDRPMTPDLLDSEIRPLLRR